jgi:dihydrofolate reductase
MLFRQLILPMRLSTPNIKMQSQQFTSHALAKQYTQSFGIVAALTKNGVIGINGSLPWESLTQDRDHFINLTRGKVLILGRKTFVDEDPSGGHVDHARACIVVSSTMYYSRSHGSTLVKVARSLDEALVMANKLNTSSGITKTSNSSIDCWVAGGERLYKDALQHPCAEEVHLTQVDITISTDMLATKDEVAYFPVDYLNNYGFQEVSKREDGICVFCVYKRQTQRAREIEASYPPKQHRL